MHIVWKHSQLKCLLRNYILSSSLSSLIITVYLEGQTSRKCQKYGRCSEKKKKTIRWQEKQITRKCDLVRQALFLKDAWMIMLQLSEFPKDGILDGRRNSGCRLGLGWLGRGQQDYLLLKLQRGWPLRQKPAILQKLCSFYILCCFSL